jgi:Flp pilus assembly pilin Flp
MWGRKHIQRLWTILTAKSAGERGAAATEYAVILMAFAITVVAALSYLGGAVGGSFADAVIASPLDEATYSMFDKQDCKNGGWTDEVREDSTGFSNQGQCVSYAVHNGG